MRTHQLRMSVVLCLMLSPTLALAAGDFGVDVTVTEGMSGCGSFGEGIINIVNTNDGAWVKVGWWGEFTGDNLLFRNPTSHEDLDGCNGIPPFDCEDACPGTDPDDDCGTIDGSCEFIACCNECACELADETGVELVEFEVGSNDNEIFRGCTLPRCINHTAPPTKPTCDNPSSACSTGSPTPFCVTLQDKPDSPNFELEKVSFDGTCFIAVDEPLSSVVESDCSP